MPRPLAVFAALVALAAVPLMAGCDSDPYVECPGAADCADPPFDPATVDYDTVATLDYEARVRPLLAARNVLSSTSTSTPGLLAAHTYDAVLMAGPSGFVVPFDAEGSLLVRMVEDLPAGAAIPFPNLRRMEADELRYVKRWIEAGAPGDHGPGFHHSTQLLYAAVQGENHVAILDAETMRVVRRVYLDDHGIASAPYGPHHVAFETDGSAWYVSLISTGAVVKLSTSLDVDPSSPGYLLGRTRAGTMTYPGMLALDPTTQRLYVGRSTLAPDLSIRDFYVVDRAAMGVETVETPPGFTLPHAMAVTPDGRFVLTASLTGNQVAVYDPATGDLRPTALGGAARELIHFAVLGAHHAGRGAGQMHAYEASLTSRSTDEVLLFSLAADGALTLAASAPAGDGPYHAHVDHDGRTLLIPNWFGNTVTLVDAVTRATTRTIGAPGGPLAQPHSPTPYHDGSRFFVSSSNRTGAWTPPLLFNRPDGSPGQPADFGNVAAFTPAGELLGVVQLGAYPSGLEHPMAAGHDH